MKTGSSVMCPDRTLRYVAKVVEHAVELLRSYRFTLSLSVLPWKRVRADPETLSI